MQTTVNSNIVNYIATNQNLQSRYEIDKYLIQAGYDPKEIDFAWLFVEQPRLANKIIKSANKDKQENDTLIIIAFTSGLAFFLFGLLALVDTYPWELDGDYSHAYQFPTVAVVFLITGIALAVPSLIIGLIRVSKR